MIPEFENMNRHARRAALRELQKTVAREQPGSYLHRRLRDRPSDVKKYMAVVRRFGRPPHDRAIVVAHEVGHIVVAAGLGGTCTGASVRKGPSGIWVGFTGTRIPSVTVGPPLNPTSEPERAFRWIISLLAGVAAEQVVGRQHPASSFEEVERARGVAAVIATVWMTSAEQVFRDAMAAAVRCIEQNFASFEAVRAMFAHADDVDAAVVNQALRAVVCLDDMPASGGGA
jgi:hypothetical protein